MGAAGEPLNCWTHFNWAVVGSPTLGAGAWGKGERSISMLKLSNQAVPLPN